MYRKIILIDDDPDDHEIFVSALERVSATVSCTTFKDARDAFYQLSSKQIDTDIIFLDLNMPYMDGQQFLTEIKKHENLSNIPVIVLTTTSNARTIELTKKLGAMDFITKPHKFDDLINILQTILK